MEIEQLLERYFEGLTSSAEEALLRRFFTADDVPEELLMYQPLFVHFDNEVKASKANRPARVKSGLLHRFAPRKDHSPPPTERPYDRRHTFVMGLCGAAACVAILIGSFFVAKHPGRCPRTGNYVMIAGRCYTDAATIRDAMQKSLHELSDSDELQLDNKPVRVAEVVENQLKEFDFLFE